jgi:hypothetical protein
MARYEGGYIGKKPTWTSTYPGVWSLSEAYERRDRNAWPTVPLGIGDFYQGGYFAGFISHTADGVATHGLIVAPAASGYNGEVAMQWKTSQTTTSGTTSSYNGAANSANMNNASHPAAQYCEGLSIDGYTDWYLPARYELDIAYHNLKPTTASNNTSWGINDYSVPKRTANRSAGTPAQTSIAAFQSGGAQDFNNGRHWSSTEDDSASAWLLLFSDGTHETGFNARKDNSYLVRAFRKFAL